MNDSGLFILSPCDLMTNKMCSCCYVIIYFVSDLSSFSSEIMHASLNIIFRSDVTFLHSEYVVKVKPEPPPLFCLCKYRILWDVDYLISVVSFAPTVFVCELILVLDSNTLLIQSLITKCLLNRCESIIKCYLVV